MSQQPFSLPDFPWDLLAPYQEVARKYSEGVIDLSQGTPVDPTPTFIQEIFQSAANSPGYPLTTGSPELRDALKNYCLSHLGATGEFDVLPTIGSKEMVAWLAYFLGVERVLIPKIAYPTYKVGALLARAQCIEVDIDARAWPKSDEKTLIWINTPSNPTGRVQSDLELREVLKHRDSGAIIASDECYFPFGDGDRPRSILDLAQGKNENLLSLHSLSKRSNLAGYRAAFIAGDKKLINELLQLRKHAGMMVSAPVQKAMAAALAEETHVEMQSQRYRARRAKLAPALASLGFSIEFSRAGLYIWCSNGDRDWDQVAWFSQRGIVVTPGSFYGEDGNRHIRIALTASDADIERTVDRISTT